MWPIPVIVFSSIIPLFLNGAAQAQLPTADGKVVVQGKEFEIYPPDLMRAKGLSVPQVPHEENAAWVHLQAINALKPLPTELSDSLDAAMAGQWPAGDQGEQLREWVESNRPALELAKQASAMPSYYMPFFRGDSDMLLAALLPTLGPSRQIARILAADATYQVSQGNSSAAIENYLVAQRMGHQIGNGKTLIEGLVGIAVANVAEAGMTRLAESGVADAETLKAALSEMQAMRESTPSFEQMVQGERQWAGSFVDDVMERPGGLRMAMGDWTSAGEKAQSDGWTRLSAALSRVYYPDRAVKRHFNDHFEHMIRATASRGDGSVGELVDEETMFERIPAWDIISRMMMPSLSRAHEMTLHGESNFVRAEIALAIAAYRQEKGVNPASLGALVPQYLPEVPADPMTGYDFDYVASGPDGKPQGISQLTRESAEELRKKRRTPVILTPRASKWRRFTQSYAKQHDFTDAQRASAEAILRDIESRAATFERAQGATLQSLIAEGQTDAARAKMGPLDDLFTELKKRLNTLPTAKQRDMAKGQSAEGAGR